MGAILFDDLYKLKKVHDIIYIAILFLVVLLFIILVFKNDKIEYKQEFINTSSISEIVNVINVDDAKYECNSEYIKLSEACSNVQKNLNISTAEAIYAVTSTDNDNIELLAKYIYSISKDLNDETQINIASVILNRVNSLEYPNSIFGVINQECQSSLNNIVPDERSCYNAKFVYENGSQISSDILYFK